ncbi:hypothetical protein [Pseudobacteriovorax antillogorgiicola]|uniref:Uncharacterized protein n=1 Tax=Pseudobacteriovorax antillogorgiicola TaxID=1513793 RepID=A0A1Y6CND2_9BACT|nr:hypothetical protein [Pseudobacteriovorax antillogorgiicola]TCS46990.1 hypothetical protein EDD56_12285 [Pseudobacteriovorax antillogorgiicola]SMF64883.1 hypothetical protein SAMN06296036_12285 [Pseudobacteriovorax antillogorgiicola]
MKTYLITGIFLLLLSPPLLAETLTEYALNCETHVGGEIPTFSCLDGAIIPIQGSEQGPCENPQILNGECWNYSRLGKLESGDQDVEIRFLCRHYNKASGPDDYIFNDIALIQKNMKTGATCFFQSPSGYRPRHDGRRIQAPRRGDLTVWQTPEVTASQECVGCHDNRGFLKTPFVQGVEGYHAVPRPTPTLQYYFPGDVTDYWRVYEVRSTTQPTCSGCHTLGMSNVDRSFRGTARTIGLQAAGLRRTYGQVLGASPWMPYGEVSAQAHARCVANPSQEECQITAFDHYEWDNTSYEAGN